MQNGDYNNPQFNDDRLKSVILKNAHSSLEVIQDNLIQELDTITNKLYTDDLTFIIARASKEAHELASSTDKSHHSTPPSSTTPLSTN